MRRHAVEALGALAGALLVTLVIAAPVVRAPSERLFGAEIVGRHHDPFTVMQQFAGPARLGLYSQPVTDLMGTAMARAAGPVAAYNWLVLVSFPLSAFAAYLLARHLAIPPWGALLAALLFAFSPFHLAQAAYHPHIAQTQWLPLYFLALWRCLDGASWSAVAWLCAAAAAVTLSNFYGGLIAAVITPIAAGAYWAGRARFAPHAGRNLSVTAGTLAALAAAGVAFVVWHAPELLHQRAAFAFPREDLFWYSATAPSYLVPPVANPLAGDFARRFWSNAHVGAGLLERQVSLGWGVIALASIAAAGWVWRTRRPSEGLGRVPILVAVAGAALICSLAPASIASGLNIATPSTWLYPFVPMFRAYARFGVVVQLMAALLAGIGATRLVAGGTAWTRAVAGALVLMALGEYAVLPSALSRDVLPTAAHRWVMQRTSSLRVFDCWPLSMESQSIPWLTDDRISLAAADEDCAEPGLAARLWAAGFTHLLVRDTWERQWLRANGDAQGLHGQARFDDGDVFAIVPRSLVYTQAISGFWPREHRNGDSWRWMANDASWTIASPTPRRHVTLDVNLHAFQAHRPLLVTLDDKPGQMFDIGPNAATYRIGPLVLAAGSHRLTFHSPAAPTIADEVIRNGDRRALSIAVGAWQWSAE